MQEPLARHIIKATQLVQRVGVIIGAQRQPWVILAPVDN